MIPTIEKNKLAELYLSPEAKSEAIRILSLKQNINGFKFGTKGKRCVAVGKFSGNDFDLWKTVKNIQYLMDRKGRAIPDRFRFVFLS